jgi:hypothetical protein
MKVKIEIEIIDETVTDDELKSLLAEGLYNICYKWVVNEEPPFIEFTNSEPKSKEKGFFKLNWDETEQ